MEIGDLKGLSRDVLCPYWIKENENCYCTAAGEKRLLSENKNLHTFHAAGDSNFCTLMDAVGVLYIMSKGRIKVQK